MAVRSIAFNFSDKIVEIFALLATEILSSKIYIVGMLFCILWALV